VHCGLSVRAGRWQARTRRLQLSSTSAVDITQQQQQQGSSLCISVQLHRSVAVAAWGVQWAPSSGGWWWDRWLLWVFLLCLRTGMVQTCLCVWCCMGRGGCGPCT
jgi:hypothetical protein